MTERDTLTARAGRRIRLARKDAGWTLRDLGRATALSVSHLSEIERGVAPITLDLLETLGQVSCVSPLWFLDIDGPEQERNRRAHAERTLAKIAALAAGEGRDGAI